MINNKKQCTKKNYLPLTFEVIGGRWKPQILYYLHNNGTLRYSELKNLIGTITGSVLSKSLKELEEYKLIIRTQYNEMPLKVEYSLGPHSEELLKIIEELNDWGGKVTEYLSTFENQKSEFND